MFESAELGHRVGDRSFRARVPRLRSDLLEAQYELKETRRFPVVVLINGVEGAGKGETANLLFEWQDPRYLRAHATRDPQADAERERPWMWPFWRDLPARGNIGVFFGSWYTRPIVERVTGVAKKAAFEHYISIITHFERLLTDEGVLLLKFWFHLSREQQKERFARLRARKATRWRVTDTEMDYARHYDEFRSTSERVLRETSSGHAPWTIIEGWDKNYRALTVGTTLLEALREQLSDGGPPRKPPLPPSRPHVAQVDILSTLDLSKKLAKVDYKKDLERFQGRLNLLSRDDRFRRRHAVMVVFEGWDAAGKGGAIRRVTSALDTRYYSVIPVAAPTEEERARPYLWRFWRHVPGRGEFVLYDRSWYGRVLVERVEGYAPLEAWQRAYREINDFEEQCVESGIIVAKFWLHISPEEQLRRFRSRERTGFKSHKITDDDWRNRKKWAAYDTAACDMFDRTSTEIAPWTLVEANDKGYARVKILRTLVLAIEAALG